MKVTSHVTLVTGKPEAPVSNPPGTVVDLAPDEAKRLIERGLAVEAPKGASAAAPPPPPPADA